MKNLQKQLTYLFPKYIPFLLSITFLFINTLPELINPVFTGDSGLRLLKASQIIIRPLSTERVWLPFLQLHINTLYRIKAIPMLYKMIPISYFKTSLP